MCPNLRHADIVNNIGAYVNISTYDYKLIPYYRVPDATGAINISIPRQILRRAALYLN
jgi:hypothetical protein